MHHVVKIYYISIRSMRKTIEEVETNMAYRWFLGYGFNDKVPPTPRSGKIMSDALKIGILNESQFN